MEGVDVTQRMADWCIAELEYWAEDFKVTGAVRCYDGDVVKSDVAVPATLKEVLKAGVAVLEDVPPHLRDWHPQSDDQVLDLVRPSLCPLVYGLSRILPSNLITLDDCIKRTGEGVIIPVPSFDETQTQLRGTVHSVAQLKSPFSNKFQWLPCDVDIPAGGTGEAK